MTDGDHRVVQFRPRPRVQPPAAPPEGLAPDLSQFEKGEETADDYRNRMITNVVAVGLTAALTGAGIWLAVTLADLRNTQDCLLSGRRDCGHISAQTGDSTRQN